VVGGEKAFAKNEQQPQQNSDCRPQIIPNNKDKPKTSYPWKQLMVTPINKYLDLQSGGTDLYSANRIS